jgi:hypothetical protein
MPDRELLRLIESFPAQYQPRLIWLLKAMLLARKPTLH